MAERLSNTRTDAYAQFRKWLGLQPCWLQDATYRIYHGLSIDTKQIETYADMCVSEIRKEKPSYRHIEERDIDTPRSGKKMAVLGLTDIVGVNALAPDAKLDFSPEGVTVVYGLNGAGKSGFMRIFKQLSGSPYEEPIQPNVFVTTLVGKPSCTFRVLIDDQEQSNTYDLIGKAKVSTLSGCDVFDTRISNAYINNPNNPSYQPFVFTVLSELSKVADRVNSHIHDMIQSITPVDIVFPEHLSFPEDTLWVRTLDAESVIPPQFSVWTEAQEKRLIELPSLLDTDNVAQRLQLYRTQLKALSPILKDLATAKDVLLSSKIETAFDNYRRTKARLAASEKLFIDSADELDRISLSSQDWKALWSAAKRYYETTIFKHTCKHFGEEGSICPLCHQEIIEAKAIRYRSVNEYVNGSCSEDHRSAINTLQSAIALLCNRSYRLDQIRPAISDIVNNDSLEKITKAYRSLFAVKDETDIEKAYALASTISVDEAIAILSDKVNELENEIAKMNSALNDEKRIEMQQELNQLKCHKWIYESMAAIKATVAAAKRKKELADAMTFLSTNKITIESNKLADALITTAYIERFTSELKSLAPNIRVRLDKAASRKGNSPYKVILDSAINPACKTEDILSEGEQRIVALAAFFADATGREEHTPLIIDDPISSLDYNYEDAATKRIVELARDRQVIVFTHRISLLVGIKDLCESEGIPWAEKRIRSAYKGKGVPDFDGNYYGKIPAQLNEIIGRISQIKKKDPDSEEFQDAIGRICQQFRICVERTVEDELLFGMVKRFSRRIRTDGLIQKLPVIEKKDCEMIDSMMTKYSFMEHSQPAETPPAYFGIDEIQSDVQAFSDWLSEFRSRAKKM